MKRRNFLASTIGGAALSLPHCPQFGDAPFGTPPSFHSAIEVVGDGRWIWIDPPANQRGYLEPRVFDFTASIAVRGTGGSTQLTAATILPVEYPEQRIMDVEVKTTGCGARVQRLSRHVSRLFVSAATVAPGQTIQAQARMRLVLAKQHLGFHRDLFPLHQKIDRTALRHHLGWSPGIQHKHKLVKSLAHSVAGHLKHPWDKAQAFKKWVWKHIEMKVGRYTSVVRAIRNRKGDCEERASVFAAMCRHCGIPTRSVWVPNHVWAEFFLIDKQGKGHWIPAHTSGYRWFGFTGVHELVLQKGDLVREPGKKRKARFLHDWTRCLGSRPRINYTAVLTPVATKPGEDAGPGGRVKPVKGPWVPGNHPLDKYFRDGVDAERSPYRKNKKPT